MAPRDASYFIKDYAGVALVEMRWIVCFVLV